MKASSLFALGLFTTLLGATVVPACSAPASEDEPSDETDQGELTYATQGTCDGLPRVAGVKTPAGVCVGVVATGFTYARGIAQLPSGDLILAEMGGWAQDHGAVWLLHRNADKTFAKTRLFAKIDKPSGVAVGPDGLPYVGTPANIFRFDPYKIDPSLHQPRIKLVVKDLPNDGRHPLKRFVFDQQKPWTMYVNVGSFSDVCEQGSNAKPPTGFPVPCPEAEGDKARGGIRAYDLDNADHVGASFNMVARGLRNSMALAVHPQSNTLVQGENSRDTINKLDASLNEQEAELPHEELNVIQPGANYGWPYCIDNGVPNPEYRGRVDCTSYTSPAMLLPAHVSPLGMAFYSGPMFPQAYQGNLLVTFHGYRDYGHRLVMIPFGANGMPTGEPLDVIRGWDKSATGPMGAPVDVMVAKDGSIFVTEDKNGTVLRVVYESNKGDGAPMQPVGVQKKGLTPEEQARCADLQNRNDSFSIIQKNVIDPICSTCHGVDTGNAKTFKLLRCDAIGNAKRLTTAPPGGTALVEPGNENSELVKFLKGDGRPQMPAGGLNQEQMDDVMSWIRAGAPVPQ